MTNDSVNETPDVDAGDDYAALPVRARLEKVPMDLPEIDQPVEEAQEAAPGRALRVRIQPSIYLAEKENYQPWSNVVWIVELADAAEVSALRVALDEAIRGFVEARKR